MPDEHPPNALIHERSPYLQQHAYNPVDWQPWTDSAFKTAAELDRPVFVSIGYATCHWCHVMAHESFEDATVAAYLNDHFICIKVDREERPDIDSFCMDVCQALTGHGGWPLTIFMDPDKKPFFAGTYFPRHSSTQRMGFLELTKKLREVWDTDRQRLNDSASEIVRAMTEETNRDLRSEIPDNIFDGVVDYHKRTFDRQHGGFGSHPKFPSPHHLLLLLRIAHRATDSEIPEMVFETLKAMRAGGIYDQVGFGFHRYSTDREWLVPHFEKMLYDQAMMMMAFTEAWQVSSDPLYKQTVLEIAEYIEREMTSAKGAFYSAQDADSEGVEGKYYVWTSSELKEELATETDYNFLAQYMGVSDEGNFADEATGSIDGSSILHDTSELKFIQSETWQSIRDQLLVCRRKRIPPITDTKILADWNGLMIMALAKSGRTLSNSALTTTAARAYHHVVQLCQFRSESATHVGYDDDHTGHQDDSSGGSVALLDDWAMMGCAALELYQATGDASYLTDAQEYARVILANFLDEQGRLLMNSSDQHGSFYPIRNGADSAHPSGNSMAAQLFCGLSAIRHDGEWKTMARRCVESYGMHLHSSAPAYCMLLSTWYVLVNGTRTIEYPAVSSLGYSVAASRLGFIDQAQAELNTAFLPDAFVRYATEATERTETTDHHVIPGHLKGFVLICTETSCLSPLTSIDEVRSFLRSESDT